jgi:hypothetical protein
LDGRALRFAPGGTCWRGTPIGLDGFDQWFLIGCLNKGSLMLYSTASMIFLKKKFDGVEHAQISKKDDENSSINLAQNEKKEPTDYNKYNQLKNNWLIL